MRRAEKHGEPAPDVHDDEYWNERAAQRVADEAPPRQRMTSAERQARFKERHPERSAEYQARFKARHPERARENAREGAARYRARHPERWREANRRRAANLTPEYRAWQGMKQRCSNPNTNRYERYGGRGIGVCERWRNSFADFLADMGPRPSPKHSIDRVDNDGNYEPANCHWATKKEQVINRRNSVMIEFSGKRQCLVDWARELSIPITTIKTRYYRRGKSGAELFAK